MAPLLIHRSAPSTKVTVDPSGLHVVTGTDVQAALAQLDARAAAVPIFDASGIADGLLMAYNAVLGKFVPTNKAGAAEIAYQANVTGTPTAIANAQSTDIPGVTFTVQPDTRPLYIQAGFTFQQTTTGDGSVIAHINDTTLPGDIYAPAVRLPNTTTAGIKTVTWGTPPFRIGPLAVAQTYKLTIQVSGSGATPAVSVLNSVANPTWLRVYA